MKNVKKAAPRGVTKSPTKPVAVKKTAAKSISRVAAKPAKTSKLAAVRKNNMKTLSPVPSKQASGKPAGGDSAETRKQAEQFAKAVEHFHARDFKRARDLFQQAVEGPVREVAFASRTHLRICEQKLQKQTIPLDSPEDRYNYAIALINKGEPAQAREQLEKAVRAREADHYYYALALCFGQLGDYASAALNLEKAIAIDPRNRSAARSDPDFHDINRHSEMAAVLYAEAR